jgi:hypothetical protein
MPVSAADNRGLPAKVHVFDVRHAHSLTARQPDTKSLNSGESACIERP